MSDLATQPTPALPVLVGDSLRVEVVCKSDKPNSPFLPITVQVVPFTRTEYREYLEAMDGKKGAELEKVQNEQFAKRIKKWDVRLALGTDAPAEINPGTVARLPLWAVLPIEEALCGETGRLVGN